MNNIMWSLTPEHFLACFSSTGFLVHGLIALASLVLFIWWTRKDALMSFRAWALFMIVVHVLYFLLTCSHIRAYFGLTMNDIFFLRGVEVFATFFTMIRLYFIIEAHGIDLSEKNGVEISPINIIKNSIKMAIITPENPKKINKYTKKTAKKFRKCSKLKAIILKVLF